MIKKLYQQVTYKIRLLTAFSMLLVAGNKISASPTDNISYEQSSNSDEESSIWDSKAFIVIGSIALGAAAGAAVSVAVSSDHHGKSNHSSSDGAIGATGPAGIGGIAGSPGISGAQGATGPSPFVVDVGNSLVFDFYLTLARLISGSGMVVPFVTQPDGTTIEAQGTLVTGTGDITLQPVTISNPEFGSYTFGIQFPSGLLDSMTTILFDGIITDQNENLVTTIMVPTPAIFNSGPAQVSGNFVHVP